MNILLADTQKKVENSLVEANLVSWSDLDKLRKKAEETKVPLMSLLVNDKYVTEEQLTKIMSNVNKIPYVNLSNAKIDQQILELLPQDIAEHYMAVPLGEMQNRLIIAMLDADNVQAVDFLANKIGRPIKVYAASEQGIRNVLKQYKLSLSREVTNAVGVSAELNEEVAKVAAEQQKKDNSKNIETIVQDSPISKTVTSILEYAANNRASDIHMEPTESIFKIRCRIDGVLREIMQLPKGLEPALVSRIKILSNLKIDEHRVPQDGEFTVRVADKQIDLRIAISPVIWGEQVVIRLLDKSSTSLKLEDMGYYGRTLQAVRNGIAHTSGMVLTSGPTGSGKTTSLYALLQEIKSDSINIVTMEDPVEYKIGGINQIQVNNDVGLTFATGLRSILRQDPDVIMVGEIRDKETAELAVQAALTGHLVFSTLHTNSAAGILPRLLDMGIEPFLIASTVRTIIGQRLVRRLGEKVKKHQSDLIETTGIKQTIGKLLPKTAEEREKVSKELGYDNLPVSTDNAYTLYEGVDSADTPGGYKGRIGIYEAFEVNTKIQELILKRSTSSEIQNAAQEDGMILMRQDGFLKALAGKTTIQEINRVASADSA